MNSADRFETRMFFHFPPSRTAIFGQGGAPLVAPHGTTRTNARFDEALSYIHGAHADAGPGAPTMAALRRATRRVLSGVKKRDSGSARTQISAENGQNGNFAPWCALVAAPLWVRPDKCAVRQGSYIPNGRACRRWARHAAHSGTSNDFTVCPTS